MARQSEQGRDRKGGPSATGRTDFYLERGGQGNVILLSFHKTTLPLLLSGEQTEGQERKPGDPSDPGEVEVG